MNQIVIGDRKIGKGKEPFVIAEIGINHEGNIEKAIRMVDDAFDAGCECVKFQTHIIEDEMIPNDVIPGNTNESIWEIMDRCQLSEEEDITLKAHAESKGMIYLSTPFSRAAANRLEKMNVPAYKVGSGECNNYPLVEHIAEFGKPIILSTGMNDIESIGPSAELFRKYGNSYALLHCTSMYPTPYEKVRLEALFDIQAAYPDAVIGFSDHSIGNYASFAAVALGASIIEKHFTSDKNWPGPDISISIDPEQLRDLITGSKAVYKSLAGNKSILQDEKSTIDFAYACVVAIKDIKAGEKFSRENIWVKRPGTGEILAKSFNGLIGKLASSNICKDTQLSWKMVEEI